VGLLNNDNIAVTNLTTTATTNSVVGVYQVFPQLGDPTSKLGNYSVVTNIGSLTVTQAVLTVSVNSTNRAYGQPNPAFTSALVGLQNSDNISVTNYTTAATPVSPVGIYPVLPLLGDPGSKLTNYSVVTNSGTLTVSQSPLTVVVNNTNRAYGQPNPTFTGTAFGLLNGDVIIVTNGTTTAATNSSVGLYQVFPQLSDPGTALLNYVVLTNAGTLTVTQTVLTVTVNNTNRAYGVPNPAFTSTVTGLQNGDNITVTNYTTTANTNSPVGTYQVFPQLADAGSKLANYSVLTNAGTLTVGYNFLTITVNSTNRAYGQSNPAFTSTVTGLQDGDNITVTNYSTAATTNSPVGSYQVLPQLNDPAGVLGNYTVLTNAGPLTVTQTVLTVTVNSTNRPYGQPNPAFTSILVGLQNGDNISVTNYATVATTNSPVASYSVLPQLSDSGLKLGNYSVLTNAGTLTVTQTPLTVTVNSTNRAYGQSNPGFTSAIVGLQNGDNISVTNCTTAATTNSPVGAYQVFPQLSDPASLLVNYSVLTNAGTLTVTQTVLTVTVNSTNRGYAQLNPAFSSTVVGLQNGDNITVTNYTTTATTNSSVGAYQVFPQLSAPAALLANYSVLTNAGSLTVTQIVLTVTVNSTNRPFGQANPAFTSSVVGLQNGDNISVTNYTTTATTTSPAGPYPVLPQLGDSGLRLVNYSVLTNVGTLTITPGALVVLEETDLIAEGCTPPNNAIDPGETVTVLFGLMNNGVNATTNLVATLLDTNGVVLASGPQTFGALTPGGDAVGQAFTFTASGNCGDTITATLHLQDGSLDLGNISAPFTLGAMSVSFLENFDSVTAPALPGGWTTVTNGNAVLWVTETNIENSPRNGAFIAGQPLAGLSQLVSPPILIPVAHAQLSFQNSYNLEAIDSSTAHDGGVLEIQVGTNDFTDILTAGGSFVTGGYDHTIANSSLGYGNPLAGRPAWSGVSAGFINTTVNLPASAFGQNVRFRWSFGSDNGGASTGWVVDSLSIFGSACCANSMPVLAAQNDRSILESTALVVTNTVLSPGLPLNPITYSLVNPPAGASIDANGIITWTPDETQGPGTNLITTIAQNSGVPQLAATNTFTVVVLESNTAPVLQSQTNRVLTGLATLTVDNHATDSDVPVNTLAYALLVAPTNAAIDSNGLITWTPNLSQVPSTNVFTTQVTDFNPWAVNQQHLSATNSFTVVVNAIHNPPHLPSQTNRTILASTTLAVTNTATATNMPLLSLSYQLTRSPGGAEIDTNGVITWTPNPNQAGTTNTFTTVVADSGSPSLTATNSFNVVVMGSVLPFPIISFGVTNGVTSVTWNSVSGHTYRLQYRDSLASGNWNDVVPDVPASGTTTTATQATGGANQRFYRVLFVQ
jgi:hypothetical protein